MTAAPATLPTTLSPNASPAPAHSLDSIIEATQQAAMRVGNPVTGDAAAKLQMFTEIAATYAQVRINGWDTVAKCKYACFLGDAYMIHPSIIMSRSWCLTLKGGKLGWKPMWDFTVDMLTARLPGFQFKVLADTPEKVEIEMSLGKNSHRVSYSMEDARRQGIADKDAWRNNTREMLMAKAVDRGAKRIGGGVWSGLMPPVMDEDADEVQPTAKASAPSDPSSALASAATGTAFDPAIAEAPKKLADLMDRVWNGGKPMAKDKRLEKLTLIYSQMTGVQSPPFQRYDAISPGDAKLMLDWMEKKYPNGKVAGDAAGAAKDGAPNAGGNPPATEPEQAGGAEAATAEAAGMDAPPADDVPPVGDLDAPPALVAPEPEAEPEPVADSRENDQDAKVETIFMLAAKAKKSKVVDRVDPKRGALSKRSFVREIAPGSGRWFFEDIFIAKDLGYESAVMIQEGGEQSISDVACRTIVREMRRAGVE